MMRRYEQIIRSNMASAERDMQKPEDGRGFVIGAILRLWEAYYRDSQIDESQISEQVKSYKDGNPPVIIGF